MTKIELIEELRLECRKRAVEAPNEGHTQAHYFDYWWTAQNALRTLLHEEKKKSDKV